MMGSSDSFDTDVPGTTDRLWLDLLKDQPRWAPQAQSLIVVSPHPDDEVLGAGGLIASYVRLKRSVLVVSVTDGEGAFPDWHGLDRLRREELKTALRHLGAADGSVIRLGLPDGKVRNHMNELRSALSNFITPSVLLVAPYEDDGHPDHDAVGRVCLELARERQALTARYPIWAWHQCEPRSLAGTCWGRFELDTEVREAKRRAIGAFASQLQPPESRKPIVPAHVLPYFTRSFESFLL
jgi:LmbE family N-acetylglucosaminyl deacetylase